MSDMQNVKGKHSYLLLMEAGLVASDLTQIILAFDPGASIALAPTLDAALEHARDTERISSAILELGPDTATSSGLARLIADRGGRIILIGDDAEALAGKSAWPVIERPFTTELVTSVLGTDYP